LPAAVADGELPRRQPVGDRASVAECNIHGAQGALDKLRPEVGLVVIELQVDAESGLRGPLRGDFPFPFWIGQIPIRFKFFRVDEVGIVRQAADAGQRNVDKDESVLAVREDMLAIRAGYKAVSPDYSPYEEKTSHTVNRGVSVGVSGHMSVKDH
jgi:hypothetical protein